MISSIFPSAPPDAFTGRSQTALCLAQVGSTCDPGREGAFVLAPTVFLQLLSRPPRTACYRNRPRPVSHLLCESTTGNDWQFGPRQWLREAVFFILEMVGWCAFSKGGDWRRRVLLLGGLDKPLPLAVHPVSRADFVGGPSSAEVVWPSIKQSHVIVGSSASRRPDGRGLHLQKATLTMDVTVWAVAVIDR